MDRKADRDWAAYYTKLKDRPPRPTAMFAAARFAAPGQAVDLGCGAGRDVLPLLAQGWQVLGIDKEPSAIAALNQAAPADLLPNLKTACTPIEDAEFGASDLINSSFALPLVPKQAFPNVWRKIRASLRSNGRFSGQIYGVRDSWARGGAADGLIAFSRAECLNLLAGMRIEFFEEEEHDGLTPRGTQKHWHIFHLVAQKP